MKKCEFYDGVATGKRKRCGSCIYYRPSVAYQESKYCSHYGGKGGKKYVLGSGSLVIVGGSRARVR